MVCVGLVWGGVSGGVQRWLHFPLPLFTNLQRRTEISSVIWNYKCGGRVAAQTPSFLKVPKRANSEKSGEPGVGGGGGCCRNEWGATEKQGTASRQQRRLLSSITTQRTRHGALEGSLQGWPTPKGSRCRDARVCVTRMKAQEDRVISVCLLLHSKHVTHTNPTLVINNCYLIHRT